MDQRELTQPESKPEIERPSESLAGTLIGFGFWFVVISFFLTIVTLGAALPLLLFSVFVILPCMLLGCAIFCWRIFRCSLLGESMIPLEAYVGARWARPVGLFAFVPAVILLGLSGFILLFAYHKL